MSKTDDYRQVADRVTADGDRDVWVVEYKTSSEWKVSAVLTSYADAEAYEEDLREFITSYPDDVPERFRIDEVRTRHGGRRSPTKFYEEWPPDE